VLPPLLRAVSCRPIHLADSPKPIETWSLGRVNLHRYIWRSSIPTRRLGGFHAQTSQWRNFLLECLPQSHERSVFTSGNGDAGAIRVLSPVNQVQQCDARIPDLACLGYRHSRRIFVGNRRPSLPPITF